MVIARRISRYGETVELERWADGTYVVTLDGERVATVLNAKAYAVDSVGTDADVANDLFLAL